MSPTLASCAMPTCRTLQLQQSTPTDQRHLISMCAFLWLLQCYSNSVASQPTKLHNCIDVSAALLLKVRSNAEIQTSGTHGKRHPDQIRRRFPQSLNACPWSCGVTLSLPDWPLMISCKPYFLQSWLNPQPLFVRVPGQAASHLDAAAKRHLPGDLWTRLHHWESMESICPVWSTSLGRFIRSGSRLGSS